MNEMNFEVGVHVQHRGSYGDLIFVITSFATGEASELHISFHQALAALQWEYNWILLRGKPGHGVSLSWGAQGALGLRFRGNYEHYS